MCYKICKHELACGTGRPLIVTTSNNRFVVDPYLQPLRCKFLGCPDDISRGGRSSDDGNKDSDGVPSDSDDGQLVCKYHGCCRLVEEVQFCDANRHPTVGACDRFVMYRFYQQRDDAVMIDVSDNWPQVDMCDWPALEVPDEQLGCPVVTAAFIEARKLVFQAGAVLLRHLLLHGGSSTERGGELFLHSIRPMSDLDLIDAPESLNPSRSVAIRCVRDVFEQMSPGTGTGAFERCLAGLRASYNYPCMNRRPGSGRCFNVLTDCFDRCLDVLLYLEARGEGTINSHFAREDRPRRHSQLPILPREEDETIGIGGLRLS